MRFALIARIPEHCLNVVGCVSGLNDGTCEPSMPDYIIAHGDALVDDRPYLYVQTLVLVKECVVSARR